MNGMVAICNPVDSTWTRLPGKRRSSPLSSKLEAYNYSGLTSADELIIGGNSYSGWRSMMLGREALRNSPDLLFVKSMSSTIRHTGGVPSRK